MKSTRLILTFTVLCCYLSSVVHCRRMRRRLDEFGDMILLTTDRNPMDFNGYGNWCGLGGKGKTADRIDECCKAHDKCYLKLNNGGNCDTLLKYRIYTTAYKWSFKSGEIICNDDDPCAGKLCRCDRKAAKCFGQHKDEYNTENKHSGIMRGIARLLG